MDKRLFINGLEYLKQIPGYNLSNVFYDKLDIVVSAIMLVDNIRIFLYSIYRQLTNRCPLIKFGIICKKDSLMTKFYQTDIFYETGGKKYGVV